MKTVGDSLVLKQAAEHHALWQQQLDAAIQRRRELEAELELSKQGAQKLARIVDVYDVALRGIINTGGRWNNGNLQRVGELRDIAAKALKERARITDGKA